MNDKDKIYFQACLYAINKLMETGSSNYAWKTGGEWHSTPWSEICDWISEKLNNVESEDILLDKIRAEIESQREEASKKDSEDEGLMNFYFGLNDGLKDARDIIDNYRE